MDIIASNYCLGELCLSVGAVIRLSSFPVFPSSSSIFLSAFVSNSSSLLSPPPLLFSPISLSSPLLLSFRRHNLSSFSPSSPSFSSVFSHRLPTVFNLSPCLNASFPLVSLLIHSTAFSGRFSLHPPTSISQPFSLFFLAVMLCSIVALISLVMKPFAFVSFCSFTLLARRWLWCRKPNLGFLAFLNPLLLLFDNFLLLFSSYSNILCIRLVYLFVFCFVSGSLLSPVSLSSPASLYHGFQHSLCKACQAFPSFQRGRAHTFFNSFIAFGVVGHQFALMVVVSTLAVL